MKNFNRDEIKTRNNNNEDVKNIKIVKIKCVNKVKEK